MNVERLQNLVRALRETKDPDRFTMNCIMHKCGTPACALGQYASRTDIQDAFRLDLSKKWEASSGVVHNGINVCWSNQTISDHFGISEDETAELFDADGCGNAQTADEAAHYVEEFIKHKRLEALDEMVRISEDLGLYDK